MADLQVQNPPILDDDTNYISWKKDLEVWRLFTSTVNVKKGPRLYLCLKGKARELVRDLTLQDIGAENGVDLIVNKLDAHYKKNDLQVAYIELEAFEKFRRKSSENMQDYITGFEKVYNRVREHDMELPDGVLAYKLLHHAKLTESNINLIKATITELSYEEMRNKMQTIFSDITTNSADKSGITVENTMYVNDYEETYHMRNRGRPFQRNAGRGGYRGRYAGNGGGLYNPGVQHVAGELDYKYGSQYSAGRKKNPLDETGEVSKCAICQSIFHWARNCPDAYPTSGPSEKAKVIYIKE